MADESAKLVWGHWNVDRTARVHSLGQVTFSDDAEPGGTVAVIDTSRDPEWRLTARIVQRVVVSVLRPRHRFGTKNPSPVPRHRFGTKNPSPVPNHCRAARRCRPLGMT